jgi:hypothetical protein
MASKQLCKIRLIPNPGYKPNGLKSYVYLLRKYTFAPTLDGPYQMAHQIHQRGKPNFLQAIGGRAHVHNLLRKTDPSTGEATEVTAEDQQNDSEYTCPVTIGTPGQTFNLDFDTGSADLWMFSTELLPHSTLSKVEKSHTVYNPKSSSTYQAVSGSTWKISYGDGSSASGNVATDNVTIGSLVIPNQTIELAKTVSTAFAGGISDGLLGLAFSSINTVTPTQAVTPVENMIAQKIIPSGDALFTAYLGSWRDATAADKGESFYTFGSIDEDVITAAGGTPPVYTPVDNSQGFWMFDSASATVNGETIARDGNTAIADTGTTLALVDDATCKKIYDAIPGSSYDSTNQGYVFPSTVTADELPVVTFAVGGQQFAVPKEALAFADAGNGTIYGGIQSRGTMTFDILGDTFLKGIYAIFDLGNTRFGAVQRKDETTTIAPAPST